TRGIAEFSRGWGDEERAKEIQIELFVEELLGHVFQWRKLVDARVVHEYVETAKGFLRLGDKRCDVALLGNIPLHRYGPASGAGDFRNDLIRASLAGCVIDHDRRA